MSASNGVHIMGRITRDLELRHTQSGTAVCQFCVAVTRSFKDANGEYQSDFIDCVAWRNSAEFITKYFSKGALIALDGELQTRNYTDKDGNKRKATELLVSGAAFTGEKREAAAKPAPTEDDYSAISDDDLPF
jgi:single-strand DNA-binding protein|nr:MAG TPA: Single strand binding protein [Caudoviricetes sp.]